jgi:hypothetical protein
LLEARSEPNRPVTANDADRSLKRAVASGLWGDAPVRLTERARTILRALSIHVGQYTDVTEKTLGRLVASLDLGTLDRVLREGPWWSEAEHWSQLSSSTRAAWLLGWLEELAAEKGAGGDTL